MFSRVSLLPEPFKQTSAFINDAMGNTGWRRGRRRRRVHNLKCTYGFGGRCFSSSVCVHCDASVLSVRQRSRLITCSPFGFLDEAQRSHEGGALSVVFPGILLRPLGILIYRVYRVAYMHFICTFFVSCLQLLFYRVTEIQF